MATVIDVWVVDLDAPMPPGAEADLDGTETARVARFRRAEEAHRYASSHVATRRILGDRLGVAPAGIRYAFDCARCGGDHGKPTITGAELEFSLSHSGGTAVVAVAPDRPVGADVELLDRRTVRAGAVAERMFTAAEREVMEAAPDGEQAAFLRTWVAKEAFAKATGLGLSFPLSAVEVEVSASGVRLVGVRGEAPTEPWQFELLQPHPRSVAAVVAPAGWELRLQRFEWEVSASS